MPIMISHHQENPSAPVSAQTADHNEADIVAVARGGGIAFIGTVATRAFTYIYSLALIRGLGAEDFGQFTLALACVMFVGLVSSIGMPQGVVRFGSISNQINLKAGAHRATITAVRLAIPVSILLMVFVIWSASFVSNLLFNKPELQNIIRILAISIPFMSLQAILLAGTRVLKVMKFSTIVWIIQPLIALVLGLILVLRGLGPGAAALAYVVSYVCGASLALFFYLHLMKPVNWREPGFPFREMLRFSIPLSLTEWMHFANERTEIYFLGLLPNAVNISIYKIAWSLAGLETMLRLSLEQILAPYSSDLSHRREIKQLEQLYKATTKWGFTVAIMLFLTYVLFGREIMQVFDPSLAAGVWVLLALGFAQLFNEFTGPCNTILIMSGRSGLTLMNTIILFVSSVSLDWLLIPQYGLTGAAIAGASTVILVNILRVVEVWWTIKIHPLKVSFWKPVLSGVVTAGAIYFLRRNGLSGSLLIDMLMILVFCSAFLFVNVMLKLDAEDLLVVANLKRKLFQNSRRREISSP